MQGKRTAVYCRVDRGGNSEMRRDALEMQKRKLERYAAEKGLPISGYYEDDGFPGHDLNRPGLTRSPGNEPQPVISRESMERTAMALSGLFGQTAGA